MAIEKKFVSEGVKKALTNEYLTDKLEKTGYGGMEINRTPMGTQITVYSQKPGMVIGKGGKVIRKITSDLDELFNFDNPQVDVQEVGKPELNAQMMASSLANILERGWNFRKAGYNTLQRIMRSGALGCEIIISGKLTGQRSRCAKFLNGYIKHSGKSAEEIVNRGFAVAKRKSGVLGVKVSIVAPDVTFPDDFQLTKKEVTEAEKTREVKEPKEVKEAKEVEEVVEVVETEEEKEPKEAKEVEEVVEVVETEEEKEPKEAKEVEEVVEGKVEEPTSEPEEVTPEKDEVETKEVSESEEEK
ncbi:MAG: 30S ribosomal protein S3 [Halobacteriota archaeon]|nr:30S ribosomal protein S3 [Halobacteriota archaeon]